VFKNVASKTRTSVYKSIIGCKKSKGEVVVITAIRIL
jgi:hypothetical protein